ncbi:hypothetical protein [Streptomyces sp. NPDC017202]|uniref:hypothetical protein n=1 Tax=Streptomyces sp. NPDC017202 TaxID=3364981 RepID=UPI0037892289
MNVFMQEPRRYDADGRIPMALRYRGSGSVPVPVPRGRGGSALATARRPRRPRRAGAGRARPGPRPTAGSLLRHSTSRAPGRAIEDTRVAHAREGAV